MSDDRTVTKVFLGKPDGRRKEGRPTLRCQTALRKISNRWESRDGGWLDPEPLSSRPSSTHFSNTNP
jgi:hypothetical protein